MRISTLPTTGDGSTVEVDHELMLGGALEDVEIVVHHTYAVGTEEVYLDTLDTHAAYQSKLAVAFLGVVETIARAGATAPGGRGVVPYHGLYPLLLAIGQGIR